MKRHATSDGMAATGHARRRRAACRHQEKSRPAEPGGLSQTSAMDQLQVGNLKLLIAVRQLKVPLTERYSVVYHMVQSSESRLRLE